MGIEFRPATIDGVGLFIAIAGASRSGKTFSALRLARGIAGAGGKIAAIDTESKRMSHYSRDFAFDVYNMGPPFRPERFVEPAQRAEAAGYAVLVIDSFSLEWIGPGGILDWHERELDRLVALDRTDLSDEIKRLKKTMSAWIEPKRAHKEMMQAFLQLTMPVIFCLRAEDKVKPGADGKPVKLGWVPTQDKAFIYEWTVSLTLHPEKPGRVDLSLPHKLQKQHEHLFKAGDLIGEPAGEGLYAWAHSDAVKKRDQAARETAAPTAAKPKADAAPSPEAAAKKAAAAYADELIADVRRTGDQNALRLLLASEAVRRRMERLAEDHPREHDRVNRAVSEHSAAMSTSSADIPFEDAEP